MAEWITKATDALRGEKEPEPQPFEIDCDCGTHHGGFRRRKHQRIVCRSCGTALFILPSNAYPAPRAPEPKRKRRRKSRRSGQRVEVATTQAAVDASRELASKAVSELSQASAQAATRTTEAGRSVRRRFAAALMSVLRFWTPFRLVVLCILLVVAGTVVLTLRSGSEDAAISQLKQSDEAARQALEDGDISAAQDQFTSAVAALDQLDWHTGPLACEVRQLHRETTAMQDLLMASVFDIALDAEQAWADGTRDEFDAEFRLQHLNRWIVFEGPVGRVRRTSRGAFYQIDVPAAIGDQGRTIVISGRLPALDSLKFRELPREVIFAGQLKSCELSRDRRSWVLRLDADSVFLWADPENYGALGMTSHDPEQADAVSRILATQARINGLEP